MFKRLHVLFSGNVQGVGFRYTTESLANRLDLTGWVKNLPGGGVEVVAEGDEAGLKEFFLHLQKQFAGYIKQQDTNWEEATSEFKEFGIRFY